MLPARQIIIEPAMKKSLTIQSISSGLQVRAHLTKGKGWDSSGHLDAGNEAFKQFFDQLDANLQSKLKGDAQVNCALLYIVDHQYFSDKVHSPHRLPYPEAFEYSYSTAYHSWTSSILCENSRWRH